MLRWVARALRILLAGAGGIVLVWLPISFMVGLSILVLWPGSYSATIVFQGSVSFTTRDDPTFPPLTAQANFFRVDTSPQFRLRGLLPTHRRFMLPAASGGGVAWQTNIVVPLWLLAFLCLAWPVTSFLLARRRRGRGFPVEAKVDRREMFIVLLDEPGLFVFASPAEAAGNIEPIDAELEVRAAFDDLAVPYRRDWIRPNRRGTSIFGVFATIYPGEYRFVPAGPPDPAGLVRLLEEHPGFTQPPEAKRDLDALLAKLRS